MGSGPIRCRFAAAFAAMAFLVPAADAAAGGCPNAGMIPGDGDGARARKATLCLLNKERADAGLAKMRADGKLREAAEKHSLDMVDRGFFDHVAPGGVTLTERVCDAARKRWPRTYARYDEVLLDQVDGRDLTCVRP